MHIGVENCHVTLACSTAIVVEGHGFSRAETRA